jgi:DNA-binding NarL/FixJ family response regulator
MRMGREGVMERKILVGILDDHPPIIEGYNSRLRGHPHIEVAWSASNGEGLEKLQEHSPVDVLLLDIVVPVSETNRAPYPILSVIPRLLQTYTDLAILVITMHNQPLLIRAIIDAGASGYILKDDHHFFNNLPMIIESVIHGGIYLSQQAKQQLFKREGASSPRLATRQLEALSLCAAYPEATTYELAKRMGVANSTIRNLLSNAYVALDVHSRTAAVAKAQQLGMISSGNQSMNISDLLEGDDLL